MNLHLTKKKFYDYPCDMVVCFVRQGVDKSVIVDDCLQLPEIGRASVAGDFIGREGQTLLCYPESRGAGRWQAPRLLAVGLGGDTLAEESFRKAGGTVAATVLKTRARRILLVLPEDNTVARALVAQALAEGLILGSYRFAKYRLAMEDEEEAPGSIVDVAFSGAGRESAAIRQGLRRGQLIAECVCRARDMINEPANHWTPDHFVAHGRTLARQHGLKCSVLNRAQMQRLGMGGMVGVSQGSVQPPAMVMLEYRCGRKKAPTLMLVGKGLTFDSGGISLKPGQGMEEMKYDMSGGAVVMASMEAIARLRPGRIDVVGIVPATENLPGPSALKPGDVITQYGGRTVEVVNTDAEGRLILADALAYGVEKYRPAMIIDLATLTGAVIIGLGHHRTGLLGNDDALAGKLLNIGERCGEPLWRLPLGPEYRKQLKSKVADLKNVDKRDAGTITAAAFLQDFVGDIPWAHLDIAGTAWDFTEKSYIPKGPSGVGVRTLLEFIREWE